MSVTAPKGFEAAGVAAGLKASGGQGRRPRRQPRAARTPPPRSSRANRCKANPVLWSEQVVKDGVVQAVVPQLRRRQLLHRPRRLPDHARRRRAGRRAARRRRDRRPRLLHRPDRPGQPARQVLRGADAAYDALSPHGGDDAAHAIMTTDSVSKQVVVEGAGWSVGGMAKGAGMLAPRLATMLVVLTTDAVADARRTWTPLLRAATRVTFDRLDSDGCMSTNDNVDAAGERGLRHHAVAAGPHRRAHARVPRPGDAAARRRRGRRPRHRHHGPGRGQRGRRRRGRAQRRAQQPLQGRDLRQRPELGPRARGDRHDQCSLRPRRRRRRDERRLGLPPVHAGRRPGDRRPDAARGQRHRRPQVRRRPGHHLDQRPHPRLRPREQRLHAHDRHRRPRGPPSSPPRPPFSRPRCRGSSATTGRSSW